MNKVHWARSLSLASYFALLAFAVLWVFHFSATPETRISLMLLLFVAPLLIPLRGVLHARDKALIWSSLISLFYVLHGGTLWWAEPTQAHWGALEVGLAISHIISSSFFIRWRAIANLAQ